MNVCTYAPEAKDHSKKGQLQSLAEKIALAEKTWAFDFQSLHLTIAYFG